MKELHYITVATQGYNQESTADNIKDILAYIDNGHDILSAVGDGTGSVHYILGKEISEIPDKVEPKS